MANNKSKNESQETVKGKCQSKITHPAKKNVCVCIHTHAYISIKKVGDHWKEHQIWAMIVNITKIQETKHYITIY